MDYEPRLQSEMMANNFPTGTYICTTCNMSVELVSDNYEHPICPCCEEPLSLSKGKEMLLAS